MNWEEACQILGVPVTATAAEIRTQYRYKAQLLHPDKTAGLPESVRQKAQEEFKRVDSAYTVLKDLKNNPQANPPKLSVSPRYIRFKDVAPSQKKTTSIEIESVGGSYTKFWMDDSPAAWLKVIEVKSTTNDPLPLEVTIEATGGSTLRKQTECSLPIRLENEKTKTRDEVTVKVQLQMKAAPRPGTFSIFGIRIRNPFRRLKPLPMCIPRPPRRARGHKTFVVSDTHFGHANIIDYSNRPFRHRNGARDVESMNRTLVNNWNHTVSPNDIVYFLGDVAFGRRSRTTSYWLRRLNGRKITIKGNHDPTRWRRVFKKIDYNGIQFLLIHDPNEVINWNGWVIHGHKHRDNRGHCPVRYPFINGHNKTINVNLELTGYKPVDLDYLCSLGLDRIKRMNDINSIPEKW